MKPSRDPTTRSVKSINRPWRLPRSLTVGVLALAVLGGAVFLRAEAGTTILVTTTADELNSDGDCSLREAIKAANADTAVSGCPAGSGVDEIVLPPGTYVLNIAGGYDDPDLPYIDQGDLDIAYEALTLSGTDPETTIIQGGSGWDDRILQVYYADGTVIQGVTIKDGNRTVDSRGGGIAVSGGSLTLIDVVFWGNTGALGGGGLFLWNTASADLTNVDFIGNSCAGYGGAIYNWGSLTYNGGRVDLNTASYFGGGIYNDDYNVSTPATALISHVEITRNTSDSGGGITNWSSDLEVTDSLIYYNAATNSEGATGGGIHAYGSGTITLENVTITNNRANSGGGGIFQNQGTLDLNNVTIVENMSDYSSLGGSQRLGGGIYTLDGSLDVNNTIIAENGVAYTFSGEYTDCYNNGTAIGAKDFNFQGVEGTGAYACNLNGFQGAPGAPLYPGLGALADNGGPTRTHALLAGSPALDVGNPGDCPATDQRGVTRPQDGDVDGTAICDMGAYELEPVRIYLPLIER